jgi:hypothetical protein
VRKKKGHWRKSCTLCVGHLSFYTLKKRLKDTSAKVAAWRRSLWVWIKWEKPCVDSVLWNSIQQQVQKTPCDPQVDLGDPGPKRHTDWDAGSKEGGQGWAWVILGRSSGWAPAGRWGWERWPGKPHWAVGARARRAQLTP